MPWVRLHGIKDYFGMAMHLLEVPEFRCTINLVPSLLQQLLRYTEGGGSDHHLDVSRIPADSLGEVEALYLLDQCFMANVDNLIRPYPRYHELYQMRNATRETAQQALPRFSIRDLRDLQVLNNLTWFHPIAFESDAELRDFRRKGRHFTETDKHRILEKQFEILRQIIPLHKELADRGQVELTTTPYYHPIMPLLWDKRCARQAMPDVVLPNSLDSYAGDVKIQVERAHALHARLFGEKPVGMWPSEGSVAQEIIPVLAQAGVRWIATDEEILAHSTSGWVSRDGQGNLRHPEMLYRPWRIEEQGQTLEVVFRDHGLSDLIGFHYQRSEPQRAAYDLLGRIEAIGRTVDGNGSSRPPLVSVILDGENCWEYYPDGGLTFLRTFYTQAARHNCIRTTSVGHYVRENPATDRIGKLFAGSWISHNFAIWIGHQEDNTAWDLLHETRRFLIEVQQAGRVPQEKISRAWEELYIAEGSDWFWWFGDDHSSALDGLFDQLFRRHLQNVYTVLGATPPAALSKPISQAEIKLVHTEPQALLAARIDGRQTYFEWLSAGRYVCGSERGTMTLVTEGLLREVYFGFSLQQLFIRIDTRQRARDDLLNVEELQVVFTEPADCTIVLRRFANGMLETELRRGESLVPGSQLTAAVGAIVEIAVPFTELGLQAELPFAFFVEALANGQSIDRAPREQALESRVPGADYETRLWQV